MRTDQSADPDAADLYIRPHLLSSVHRQLAKAPGTNCPYLTGALPE